MTRVVLVPGVLALLPEYAGIEDPVAELRTACLEAVGWLGSEVTVLADPQGSRVARYLLQAAVVSRQALEGLPQPPGGEGSKQASEGLPQPPAGAEGLPQPPEAQETSYLVVGNGSARRTEKAPGFFDERAEAFDAELGARLRAGRLEVDEALAEQLLASVTSISELGRLVTDAGPAQVDYDDAPYGVQYWVMRWTCSG